VTPPQTPDLGADGRLLLEAVTAISSDLDLASVLTRIVEAATALTGASSSPRASTTGRAS
jgi:hypothetical protein